MKKVTIYFNSDYSETFTEDVDGVKEIFIQGPSIDIIYDQGTTTYYGLPYRVENSI